MESVYRKVKSSKSGENFHAFENYITKENVIA